MDYKIIIQELEALKQSASKQKCIPLANKIQSYINNIKNFHKQ